jgi:hypothetical protein
MVLGAAPPAAARVADAPKRKPAAKAPAAPKAAGAAKAPATEVDDAPAPGADE